MLSDSHQNGQILWRMSKHLFPRDEMNHHEEDRTPEKVLEEPPEGSQRFVAFETIKPVTEWVQNHQSQQPAGIHRHQITARLKEQSEQTVEPKMNQIKK